MIPNTKDRELTSEGVSETGSFGISHQDTAHIMKILRDTLYSDKILAVLREYGANAWDAHRSVGKGNVPIAIMLPTLDDPTLSIRDFGPGISPQDIFTVYAQYGASTKRSDDATVGMLGIGSKSGFAYADSFTVTSWFGGFKRVYVAVLDPSEKGIINLLHEEPCGDDTGVMIQLAVRTEDIHEFKTKAQHLFFHFDPQPIINTTLPKLSDRAMPLKNGYILADDNDREIYSQAYGQWTAIMGCVPYKINVYQVQSGSARTARHLERIFGVLKFDIGEVEINASREELKYSDSTKKAIISKMDALVDEFVTRTLEDVNDASLSHWEKRVRAQIFHQLRLPIPKVSEDVCSQHVELTEVPPAFYITVKKKTVVAKHLQVTNNASLIIRNDTRVMKGFEIGDHELVVRRTKGTKPPVVEAELVKYLEAKKLTGVTIKRTSELAWTDPRGGAGPLERSSAAHSPKCKTFKLKLDKLYAKNRAARWEPAKDHVASADDVFVLITRFEPEYKSFWDLLETQCRIMAGLGKPMPTIYGYRDTEAAPINKANVAGTEFNAWRGKNIKEFAIEFKSELDRLAWLKFDLPYSADIESVESNLGAHHLITKTIAKAFAIRADTKSHDRKEFYWALARIYDMMDSDGTAENEPISFEALMKKAYPLVYAAHYGFQQLWNDHAKDWFQYIKLMDAAAVKPTN